MSTDHGLELAVQRYWERGGTSEEAGDDVLDKALAHPPTSPILLARVLAVTSRCELGKFAEHVETKLAEPWQRVDVVLQLVDALGDQTLDVETAIFDHLANGWVVEDALSDLDLDALTRARLGAASRPQAARALLEALGWEKVEPDAATAIRDVLDALEQEAEHHQARVLLVTPDGQAGLPVGVSVIRSDRPGVETADSVDLPMNKQAHTVLDPFSSTEAGVNWSLEWPLAYAGESIGLALQVAALVTFEGLRPDPLLAATGAVFADGRVRHVEGIEAKLTAARRAGLQRVLLPRENEAEALAAGVDREIQLIFVDHVNDITRRLEEVFAADEMSFDGRVRKAKAALPRFGLSLMGEKAQQNSRQLIVADAASTAIIELWHNGNVTPSGKEGSAKDCVRGLVKELFVGEKPVERQPQKFMLADAWRQQKLREALKDLGARARTMTGASELFGYDLQRKASKAQITIWTTGRGYLTGNAPAFDELLKALNGAQEGLANIETEAKTKSHGPAGGSKPEDRPTEGPWIGTDESGKGDYFGPLVSAAVYADETIAGELRRLGVQDSKKLTDKRVLALAPLVKEAVGRGRFAVTTISPSRYNELYAEFKTEGKNLNSLLAWGHTRSIDDLLKNGLKPGYAIVDQFADARYIEQKLLSEARASGLRVLQYPKAESDMAVAAASILARAEFLGWLTWTSNQLGIALPKGASPQVVEVATRIAANGGREALAAVAKLHFKTTDAVLAAV